MSYWVCAFRRRIEFVNLVDFSSLWTWLLHLPLQIECYIANDSLSSWHLDDLWCLWYLDALSSSWDSNDASQNVNRMLYGKGLITLTSAGWSPFFFKKMTSAGWSQLFFASKLHLFFFNFLWFKLQPAEVGIFRHQPILWLMSKKQKTKKGGLGGNSVCTLAWWEWKADKAPCRAPRRKRSWPNLD